MRNNSTYLSAFKGNTRKNFIGGGIVLSSLLLIFLVFSQSCQSRKSAGQALPLSDNAQSLVSKLHNHLYFGKKISEEAMYRSTAFETTNLAGKIFNDNSSILVDVETIADKTNTSLLVGLTDIQLQKWNTLVKEKGRSFDNMYINLLKQEFEKGNELSKLMSLETDPELLGLSNQLTRQSMSFLAVLEETKFEIENYPARNNVVLTSAK